eukprot:scaffold405_cov243-Pinguiococcus_pyrenoidosus.AAC.17
MSAESSHVDVFVCFYGGEENDHPTDKQTQTAPKRPQNAPNRPSAHVAEELPACRGSEAFDPLLLSYDVHSGRSRHRPCHSPQAALGLDSLDGSIGPIGDDCQRVARRHEAAFPENHVAIAVAVAGGAKVWSVRVDLRRFAQSINPHSLHEGGRILEVRIRMRAAKVRQRIAPQKLQVPDLENILENLDGVWAGCPMHGVDAEREFGMLSEKVADRGVVELLLEHVDVVFRGIDDMDLHGTEIEGARSREVDLRSVFHDADRLDGLGFLVDAIRGGLRGGGAILVVELDAKVLVGTARIMRCSEDNAAIGLPLPDDRGHSRRGEQPSLPDVDLPHPVRRANAQDLRNRRLRKVPTVATEDEGFRRSFLPSIEHGLHEVRQEPLVPGFWPSMGTVGTATARGLGWASTSASASTSVSAS